MGLAFSTHRGMVFNHRAEFTAVAYSRTCRAGAFFEYCFQTPRNHYGSYEFTRAERKAIQEAITLQVFALFSITYLDETFK